MGDGSGATQVWSMKSARVEAHEKQVLVVLWVGAYGFTILCCGLCKYFKGQLIPVWACEGRRRVI